MRRAILGIMWLFLFGTSGVAKGAVTSFQCTFQQNDPDGTEVLASQTGVFTVGAPGTSPLLRLVVDANEASIYSVPDGDIYAVIQPVGSSAERGFFATFPPELLDLPRFTASTSGPVKDGHSQDFNLDCEKIQALKKSTANCRSETDQQDDAFNPGQQRVLSVDEAARRSLVGNWRLTKFEDFVDGRWVESFGANPVGYFSFGSDGRISIQFMKNPPTAVAGAKVSGAEALRIFEGYLAYFGTYVVDGAAGTFTTSVEGAWDPRLLGTKQTRSFEMVDSRLIVGDQTSYRRFFERY